MIGWSAWLALAWFARLLGPRLLALAGREAAAMPRPVLIAAGTLIAIAGIAATADVGRAVANQERPDSHSPLYAPTTALGSALVAAIPPGQSIDWLRARSMSRRSQSSHRCASGS